MECITSPALEDSQLVRYLEGEADGKVVAHIRDCPYCRERATRWESLQSSFRRRSYRFACPSPMDLGDYHLGYLHGSQALVIAGHLRECILCRGEVNRLGQELRTFAQNQDPVRPVKRLIANLLGTDGMPSLPPALGLRGEDEEALVYQAEDVQIMIDVQEHMEETELRQLLGLVDGLESNDHIIQASRGGQITATSSIDRNGNFRMDHLAPGLYELILSGPGSEIHIQPFEI